MTKIKSMSGMAMCAAAALLMAVGCGSKPQDTSQGTPANQGTTAKMTAVELDGSSTVFPIAEAVAEEFRKVHKDVNPTVGISGTGGGFQKFCRGEIDMANASRPIKPAEIEACRATGVEFIELPIAYDGLTIVVNPKNTWVQSMTVAELKKVWAPEAQGKVMRWNQVRAGWPDREIHLFGAGVDSGTFDYFTEAIMGKARASRGDYTSSEDDNTLVQGVASDELALGYFGYEYYVQSKDRLKVVPVDDGKDDNGKGPIAPSPETVRDGTYSPLARPIFVYVARKSADRNEVVRFVEFWLEKGAALTREVGSIALTDRELALARARFAKRSTGTMFAGGGQGASLEQRMQTAQ